MQKQLMMIVCASVGIAFCATAAISADDDLVAAVKERRDLMKKTVAPAAKLGGQMVKGVKPFDAAAAAKAMNEISESKIPDKDDQSEAKPEIWENFDDFKKIAMKLKDASAKAAGAAEQGKGTFTAAFNDMTKVCKECHETYREKLEQ
jgi:cytochrome c556